MSLNKKAILARLDELSPQELKRYLVQELTQKRLGLTWEADLIERDKALNSDLVFPKVDRQTAKPWRRVKPIHQPNLYPHWPFVQGVAQYKSGLRHQPAYAPASIGPHQDQIRVQIYEGLK